MKYRYLLGAGLIPLLMAVFVEAGLRAHSMLPGESPLFAKDRDFDLIRMQAGIEFDGQLTNSRGFNDREHTPSKPQGVSRLALVGDSFVFGRVAREDNLPSHLQRAADSAGARMEVLNMGVPATGPHNYLALVEHELEAYEVDFACVFFFIGNDVAAAHPDFAQRIWLGMPRPTLRHPFIFGASGAHWYSYRLIRNLARRLRERFGTLPDGATFTSESFIALETQRMPTFEVEPSKTTREGLDGSIALLERMDRAARERGIGLLVVLAPAEVQVHPEIMETMERAQGLDSADYDLARPDRVIGDRLAASGVRVLDLLPAFQERAASERLYLLQDTHWNVAGNALAASETWRALIDHGFVDLPARVSRR